METKPALYDALAKARLEFGTVVKDKTAKIASQKGNYSYTYADLASVIEATAPALAKHGLSIIQEPEVSRENGDIWLTLHGSLCHAGGEVVPFRPLTMPVGTNADARTIGTAISYARRYQLISVLNIAAEADDDDAASTTPPTRQQRTPEPQPEPPANGHTDGRDAELATAAQLRRLNQLGTQLYGAGQTWEDKRHELAESVSKGATKSSQKLTANECNTLISGLEKRLGAIANPFEPEPVAV